MRYHTLQKNRQTSTYTRASMRRNIKIPSVQRKYKSKKRNYYFLKIKVNSLPICPIGCASWLRKSHLSWTLSTEEREQGKQMIMQHKQQSVLRTGPQVGVILQQFAFSGHVKVGHAAVPGSHSTQLLGSCNAWLSLARGELVESNMAGFFLCTPTSKHRNAFIEIGHF